MFRFWIFSYVFLSVCDKNCRPFYRKWMRNYLTKRESLLAMTNYNKHTLRRTHLITNVWNSARIHKMSFHFIRSRYNAIQPIHGRWNEITNLTHMRAVVVVAVFSFLFGLGSCVFAGRKARICITTTRPYFVNLRFSICSLLKEYIEISHTYVRAHIFKHISRSAPNKVNSKWNENKKIKQEKRMREEKTNCESINNNKDTYRANDQWTLSIDKEESNGWWWPRKTRKNALDEIRKWQKVEHGKNGSKC